MQGYFKRDEAERLAEDVRERRINSEESRMAARIWHAFDRKAWPEQAVSQRIYEKATGAVCETGSSRAGGGRQRSARLGLVAVLLAFALLLGAGVLFMPRRERGRDIRLSSGSAVAREMLGVLRRPGKVTHYVVRQSVGRDSKHMGSRNDTRIDCWVDGDNGRVRASTGARIGKIKGIITRTETTIERNDEVTTRRQPPGSKAWTYITNNSFASPAQLLSDPMSGGLSKYEELLESGQLRMVGTGTIDGVRTYKLLSEFTGVSFYFRSRVTTLINARQDTFQPLQIESTQQASYISGVRSDEETSTRHVITRFVRTEVVDRSRLPKHFFEPVMRRGERFVSVKGMTVDQAKALSGFDLYYLGERFQRMRLQALVLEEGTGYGKSLSMMYQSERLRRRQWMKVFPTTGDPTKNQEFPRSGGGRGAPRVTRVRLRRGALAGREALLVRYPLTAGGLGTYGEAAELWVVGPRSTVHMWGPRRTHSVSRVTRTATTTTTEGIAGRNDSVDGTVADMLRAANSLRRLN